MVRDQESFAPAVGMTPARRHGRSAGFDALAALHALKTPILVVASDGRVDFVNVAAEELLHVSGAELVGTDLHRSLPWLAGVVLPGAPTGITAEHPATGGGAGGPILSP